MPIAVVVLEFDPFLRLDTVAVRWETLGVAAAILVALVVAAILARRTPPDRTGRRLHLDDLLYIALGIVPGAVVGGRLGYVLLHLDYYSLHPGAIIDVSQGGLQLSLAVLGGAVTGVYVARILEAPVGRWLHVATLPTLLAIEGGKAAMALGGSGQGVPSDAAWATAYLGPGPWGSLAPSVPSQPAQLIEAAMTAGIAIGIVVILASGSLRRRDGRLFLVAMGAWLVGRALVATTWRDPEVVGPLRADQLISLVLLVPIVAGSAVLVLRGGRGVGRSGERDVDWPDPEAARTWRVPPGG